MEAKRGNGRETARMDEQEVSDEERLLIGDLGNEFDDPDGLLEERPDYWADLARSRMPTRQALLRHRLAEAWGALRAMGGGRGNPPQEARVPDEVWTAMFEAEVGRISASAAAPNPDPASDEAPPSERLSGAAIVDPVASPAPSPPPARRRPVPFALDRAQTGPDGSAAACAAQPRHAGGDRLIVAGSRRAA